MGFRIREYRPFVTSTCALARTENDPPSWIRAKMKSAKDGTPIAAPAILVGVHGCAPKCATKKTSTASATASVIRFDFISSYTKTMGFVLLAPLRQVARFLCSGAAYHPVLNLSGFASSRPAFAVGSREDCWMDEAR